MRIQARRVRVGDHLPGGPNWRWTVYNTWRRGNGEIALALDDGHGGRGAVSHRPMKLVDVDRDHSYSDRHQPPGTCDDQPGSSGADAQDSAAIRATGEHGGSQQRGVTVTFRRGQYCEELSKPPGRMYGPFGFAEVIRDLQVAALLERADACKKRRHSARRRRASAASLRSP